MSTFSLRMRATVQRLLERLGNRCKLTKITTGEYNPATGKTTDFKEPVASYSTSLANAKIVLSTTDNINNNLSGFGDDSLMIPYHSGYDIDTTWLYNDEAITKLEKIESQDNIIAYIIEVGTK